MTHDGLGKYLKEKITKAPGETADIVQILKETHTDVVVSYLPVGSEQATKWYVEQILEAGCGFVNCIPVFIAREDYWNKRFKKAGLPIVGDDIKSQVGATIVHRTLARLFHERGVKMLRTSQLNVGGNMDFYNMLERERLESKKISKTNAVTSIMGHTLPADDVYIGPSDYVPWLTDRKWAHIRARGPGLRRRAAQRRDEARGLGLAELGRHRHRRRALLQAGAQPRRRRPARRPELLPHEVAAQPAPRRRGARGDREVHRQVRAASRDAAQGPRRAEARRREGRRRTTQLSDGPRGGPIMPCACRVPRDRPGHAVPLGGPSTRSTATSRGVADELAARGHRVADRRARRASHGAVRDARRRAARRAACSRGGRRPRVLAVGEALGTARHAARRAALPVDVARTVEELLDDVAARHRATSTSRSRRSVASAALRHSRALNVGTFHAPTERVVSTQVARKLVELVFGRLDARHRQLRGHGAS